MPARAPQILAVFAVSDLLDQLQASVGTAYTIERELGGGGMSHVFVALDTSLDRRVVVKVLPPEMSGGVNIERFKREISLAARLQHPHIVQLLSAGEMDGVPYFMMPFVEGESMRLRLTRQGELPVAEATRTLREIASALAYAHERGVVHRDIKPDNVLLSGGSAMVTDFGVAKALSASSNAENSGITSLGVALGTPAYMAPEQATADPAVDHRADIYAFGVLAYEMLTGQPPFAGRTPQGLLAAHVTESPEPIARRRQNIPPALAALVMRCLEKRPADRPQSALEVVHALDDITTPSGGMQPARAAHIGQTAGRFPKPATRGIVAAALLVAVVGGIWIIHTRSAPPAPQSGPTDKSVAVLPFENVRRDTSDEYFADGMTDELTAVLGRVPGVRLAARSAAYGYLGKSVDAQAVGAKLHVGSVVEGTVSRQGNQMRVTAQLINAADGLSLWSDRYTGNVKDVFAVQDSIARAIAVALKLALGANVETPSGDRTENVEAHDLYLQGMFYQQKYTEASLRKAIGLFKQSIAKDPHYAAPWAGMAWAWLDLTNKWVSPNVGEPQLREAATRALALDSTNVIAHTELASEMLTYERDYAGAEREANRALALDPNNANTNFALADIFHARGDRAGYLRASRRALIANPLMPLAILRLADVLVETGQLDSAAAWADTLGEIDPSYAWLANLRAAIALGRGRCDDALELLETEPRSDPFSALTRITCEARVGRTADAQADLAAMVALRRSQYVDAGMISQAYANIGNRNSALAWLDTADTERSSTLLDLHDRAFDPIRADPRFQALLEKVTNGRP